MSNTTTPLVAAYAAMTFPSVSERRFTVVEPVKKPNLKRKRKNKSAAKSRKNNRR
jgi:hypothetical protein